MRKEFRTELSRLLNMYSCENNSDTPDFILAEYLIDCLNAFNVASRKRETWYTNEKKEEKVLPREPKKGVC